MTDDISVRVLARKLADLSELVSDLFGYCNVSEYDGVSGIMNDPRCGVCLNMYPHTMMPSFRCENEACTEFNIPKEI